MTELEELKALEIDLVSAYGRAADCGTKLAANLIGAALEEVGARIEQRHGVVLQSLNHRYRYDN